MKGKGEDVFQVSCGQMTRKSVPRSVWQVTYNSLGSLTRWPTDSYNRQAYYQPQAEQLIRRIL